MPKKNNGIKDCLERSLIEVKLIKRSISLTGFINRIVFRFIPMLRTHPATTKVIKEWEDELSDKSLKETAYSELNDGYCLIREKAKTSGEEGIVEVLESILSRVTEGGNYHKIKDPPYQRVYPHFRAYHMNLISPEMVYAPSVLILREVDSYFYQLSESDTNPAYLWNFLLYLEKAWKMNPEDLSITWEPTTKNGIELWLDSDRKWRYAHLSYRAGNLKMADTSIYQKDFFNRRLCEQILERLLDELSLPKDGTLLSRDDKKIKDFIEDYWEKYSLAKHDDVLQALKKKISKSLNWLERRTPYQDSTLRTKIRMCDPRSHKPRGCSLKTS